MRKKVWNNMASKLARLTGVIILLFSVNVLLSRLFLLFVATCPLNCFHISLLENLQNKKKESIENRVTAREIDSIISFIVYMYRLKETLIICLPQKFESRIG